jgi:plasmid stabilization system protein ParE
VKPHAFHPKADEEYGLAAEYYAQIDLELAARFYDQVEGLILNIRRQPERIRWFDPPVHRHFSKIFPYAVLYVNQPERVLVIAVMHMKRRPGYCRNRL